MSELSEMDVRECPLCGGNMEYDGVGGYLHTNKTLDQADCVLYDRYLTSDEVERWNRRSPDPRHRRGVGEV